MIPLSQKTILSALVAGLMLTVVGCNKANTPAAGQAGKGGEDPVVATYAGKTLTLSELDQRIADQLFETRRQALEQIIIEDLVKMEAQKQGKTEEEYLKAEIEAKSPPPDEAQIKQVWEQAQGSGQLPPGTTYEQFKEMVGGRLNRPAQQERARQLFTELKTKANVDVKLQAPLPPKKEGVEAVGPSKGPENAPVTIVEFSDFQCPFCSRAATTVDEVMKQYEGKVRLVFRHFPLDFHKEAPKASEAAMCANEQGKFWEYHDALFKNQDQLQVEQLKKHAETVGLDQAKFTACLDSNKYAETVTKDLAAGKQLGVTGTPAFFINGRMLSGAQPIEEFKRVIDAELNTTAKK